MSANLDLTQFRAEDGSNTKRRTLGIYTGPASYPTNGDPLTPNEVKLGVCDVILFEHAANAALTTFYLLRWSKTREKVLWIVSNTGVEVANNTDLSGFVARFEAIGT